MYVSKCRFACVYAHAWLSVCLTNTALACGLSISFQCICVWVLLVWFGCSPPCPWHRYCVIPSMHPCHHFFYTCTFYYRFLSVHGTAKWILVYFYACIIIYHTIFCRLYHGQFEFQSLVLNLHVTAYALVCSPCYCQSYPCMPDNSKSWFHLYPYDSTSVTLVSSCSPEPLLLPIQSELRGSCHDYASSFTLIPWAGTNYNLVSELIASLCVSLIHICDNTLSIV